MKTRSTVVAGAALALVVIGCSSEQKPAPTAASPSSAMTTSSPPPADPPPPPTPKIDPMSTWKPGATVTTRGKVSTIMWQHMVDHVEGKKHAYIDVEGEKTQIVVYWKEDPKCGGLIEITGKVMEIRGQSKRPVRAGIDAGKESKVDDSYSELHIDVESAKCV